MAELPKDEPTVDSAFLFAASERIFLLRIIRQESCKSKEAEESKADPDWVK